MAVPILKELSHLPVIVDPSHAAGPARPRAAAVARRRRGGRGRDHRRGAPQPRRGDLRRAAGAARPTTFAEYAAPSSAPRRSRARRSAPSDGAPARALAPEPPPPGPRVEGRGPRRRADRRLDRPGRARAPGRAGHAGTTPTGGVRARRSSSARSTRRPRTSPARWRAPSVVFVAAPVGALAQTVREALAARRRRLRGQRRRLDQARTSAGARRRSRFIGGHPLAGAETAGRRARARGPVRRRHLVSHPGPEHRRALYERLHRALIELGAQPAAIDADAHDRLMACVSHLPHVLANVLVAQAAGAFERRGRSAGGRAELPRRDPRGRRQHARSGPTSTSSNRDALAADRRGAAAREVRARSRATRR